uniref:Synaptogyrin 3b n=1 Tax=Echeneis naucrates TaxID=173247 RepID=A0A665W7X8_ECHNA
MRNERHSYTSVSSFSFTCQIINQPVCFPLQVFSIVVFSCIVNEGYINIGSERLLCVFNNNADACNYGVTVGVACFLGSICFMILDVYFPTISSIRDRRRAVLLDLVFSGLASFLWFVGFCFLANQWQATSPDELPLAQGSDAARATIAFCFFSILTGSYNPKLLLRVHSRWGSRPFFCPPLPFASLHFHPKCANAHFSNAGTGSYQTWCNCSPFTLETGFWSLISAQMDNNNCSFKVNAL